MRSAPSYCLRADQPPTHVKFDPTGGGVDLADALYSLQEFGQACTYP